MLYWSSWCCIYCTPLWIGHGRVFKMEFFFYRQLIPSLRLYVHWKFRFRYRKKVAEIFSKSKRVPETPFPEAKNSGKLFRSKFFFAGIPLSGSSFPVIIAWKKILGENRTHYFYVNMHLLHFFTVMNGRNKCLVGFLKFAENALTSCNSLENEWIWVDDAGTGRGGGEAGGPSCWILSRVVSK